MRVLSVLLTSVLSLLLAGPTFAKEAVARSQSAPLVVAQNDQKCPPKSECAAERRKQKERAGQGKRGQGKQGQGKAKETKGQDSKGKNGNAARGKNQQGKAQQGKAQQGKAQQGQKQPSGPKRNGKAKGEGADKAAAPRNERRSGDKPRREERPAAAPAKNKSIVRGASAGEQARATGRRAGAAGTAPRAADKKPVKQDGANKPRDRQPDQNAAPERPARQPAREQTPAREEATRGRAQKSPTGQANSGGLSSRQSRGAVRSAAANAPNGGSKGAKTPPARLARQPDREATTVERQLAAQGRSDEAERVRELRRKLRGQREAAQQRRAERRENAEERREDSAERRDGRRDREVVERRGDRVIVRFGANLFIEPEEVDDRLLWRARDVEVEEFGDGFTRTIVYRENGVRIVTVRDRYGYIVSRTRYLPEGREIVLINQPYPEYAAEPIFYEEIALPPLVVPLPQPEYIVETRIATPVQIETALTAAPVEPVERAYTLEEVRRSERLRDKMRRVDIDTITFEFGSAVIPEDQLVRSTGSARQSRKHCATIRTRCS
jgi:hypothetical protein